MTKILLIGDLKTIRNWGAQGTSNCLNEYFNVKYSTQYSLTSIEHRSNISEINKDFNPYKWRTLKSLIKYLIVDKKFYKNKIERAKLKNIQNRDVINDIIPHKWEEFNEFGEKMKNSEILSFEKELIDQNQIIIINAEGSIVRKRKNEKTYRRAGRYYLFLAFYSRFIAQKPTFIINHTLDPNFEDIDEIVRNIYPKLDGAVLREHISLGYLRDLGIDTSHVKIGFDMLFLLEKNKDWRPNFVLRSFMPRKNKKYICIGDSSGLPYVSWDVKLFYQEIIAKIRKEVPEYEIVIIDGNSSLSQIIGEVAKENNCTWINDMNASYSDLFQILANSEVYMSGRWHPSILACKGRTPIILWGSDSCKTRSLHEQMNLNSNFYPLDNLNKNTDNLVKDLKEAISGRDMFINHVNSIEDELSTRARLNLDYILE